jgi:hypothetical protein
MRFFAEASENLLERPLLTDFCKARELVFPNVSSASFKHGENLKTHLFPKHIYSQSYCRQTSTGYTTNEHYKYLIISIRYSPKKYPRHSSRRDPTLTNTDGAHQDMPAAQRTAREVVLTQYLSTNKLTGLDLEY